MTLVALVGVVMCCGLGGYFASNSPPRIAPPPKSRPAPPSLPPVVETPKPEAEPEQTEAPPSEPPPSKPVEPPAPAPAPVVEAPPKPFGRTWRSDDGKFTVQAEAKSFAGDVITLVREDGKEVRVPIERLSDDDREFIEQWKKSKQR